MSDDISRHIIVMKGGRSIGGTDTYDGSQLLYTAGTHETGAWLRHGAADPGETQAVMDGMGSDGFANLSCSIAMITVSGNGFSISHTEVADLLLISDQLYSYGTRAPSSNGNTDSIVDEDDVPKDNGEDVSGSIMDSANAAYTITMVTHEGEQTEYKLVGKTLTNLTTNHTYELTQTQVNELHNLLGIPNQ